MKTEDMIVVYLSGCEVTSKGGYSVEENVISRSLTLRWGENMKKHNLKAENKEEFIDKYLNYFK